MQCGTYEGLNNCMKLFLTREWELGRGSEITVIREYNDLLINIKILIH